MSSRHFVYYRLRFASVRLSARRSPSVVEVVHYDTAKLILSDIQSRKIVFTSKTIETLCCFLEQIMLYILAES
jgi:hypothetical protein